jgi:hypothetical protein
MPFLRTFNAIEMGTNFCGQNRLGAVLFNDELIQVSDKLLGFKVKIDFFLLAGRCFDLALTLSTAPSWGKIMGVTILTLSPNFLDKNSPISFSSSLGSGIFSLCDLIMLNYNHGRQQMQEWKAGLELLHCC